MFWLLLVTIFQQIRTSYYINIFDILVPKHVHYLSLQSSTKYEKTFKKKKMNYKVIITWHVAIAMMLLIKNITLLFIDAFCYFFHLCSINGFFKVITTTFDSIISDSYMVLLRYLNCLNFIGFYPYYNNLA